MTVVVCDDERHIVRLIEVNLNRQGYRVLTCFTSSEALRLCFEHLPNVLVIDFDLVNPTTEEVLQALSDDPRTRGIQVIVMGSEGGTRPPNWPPGGGRYITKPFNPMQIMEAPPDAA